MILNGSFAAIIATDSNNKKVHETRFKRIAFVTQLADLLQVEISNISLNQIRA